MCVCFLSFKHCSGTDSNKINEILQLLIVGFAVWNGIELTLYNKGFISLAVWRARRAVPLFLDRIQTIGELTGI